MSNPENPDRSVTETCSILNVTPPTVYRMIEKGYLDSYKLGRSRRVTGDSIDRVRSGKVVVDLSRKEKKPAKAETAA